MTGAPVTGTEHDVHDLPVLSGPGGNGRRTAPRLTHQEEFTDASEVAGR